MKNQCSIAETRSRLPSLVRKVERGGSVEITRRGKPVARLTPIAGTPRAAPGRKSALADIAAFRKRWQLDKYGVEPGYFDQLRDRSVGREFRF